MASVCLKRVFEGLWELEKMFFFKIKASEWKKRMLWMMWRMMRMSYTGGMAAIFMDEKSH
jgi:hypothetical protein